MNWKKVLLWGLPITAGAIVIIILLKKAGTKKAVLNTPLTEPGAKVTTKTGSAASASAPSSSDFPLEQGDTDSDSVRTLQRILGVTVDGNFGPNTLAALKAFASMSTVADQSALDNLAAKKAAAQNSASASARAQQLYATATNGQPHDLIVTANTMALGYTTDAYGAIVYNNKNVTLAAHTYSGNDYSIIGKTNGGNVEININKGDWMGNYIINPNVITLS
jgi:peptidoglycan hydrolase-like protein with peptidoglycan-binding domain